MERDWLMQKLQLLSNTTPTSDNKQVSFQDVQSGLNGKTANGQDNSINNGQQRDQARTDKINYGGKPDEQNSLNILNNESINKQKGKSKWQK